MQETASRCGTRSKRVIIGQQKSSRAFTTAAGGAGGCFTPCIPPTMILYNYEQRIHLDITFAFRFFLEQCDAYETNQLRRLIDPL